VEGQAAFATSQRMMGLHSRPIAEEPPLETIAQEYSTDPFQHILTAAADLEAVRGMMW